MAELHTFNRRRDLMTAMAELKQSMAGLATATQRGSFVRMQETDGLGAQHALLNVPVTCRQEPPVVVVAALRVAGCISSECSK